MLATMRRLLSSTAPDQKNPRQGTVTWWEPIEREVLKVLRIKKIPVRGL